MPETPDDFHAAVRQRFTNIALTPQQETARPVGPERAKSLGYDADEIDALPLAVTESFCGVGNPLALGEPRPGETVVDIGSGAGLDSIRAARRVGPSGRVIGVDMTSAMIAKAQRNVRSVGLTNVEFRLATLEALPVEDQRVDVAISNGAFNLCPRKSQVVSEIFRVLRPGGRLQMADIFLREDVTPAEVASKGAWSN